MSEVADLEEDFYPTLRRLLHGLMPLMQELSLPQLLTLFQIAVEPGLSVNEIAARLGLPQQTASRHIAALLGRYQGTSAGSDLSARSALDPLVVQQISESDPRRRALFLSDQGKQVLKLLLDAIET